MTAAAHRGSMSNLNQTKARTYRGISISIAPILISLALAGIRGLTNATSVDPLLAATAVLFAAGVTLFTRVLYIAEKSTTA